MKNLRLPILILTLVFALSLAFAVTPAFAEASSRDVNVYEGDGFTLTTVKIGGSIEGARFYGIYFGNSDIAVTVDLYGGDGFDVDFPVNEQESNLNSSQRQTRTKLISLAQSINAFVRAVDSLANTQYDGSDGLPLSDVYRYNAAEHGQRLEISQHTYTMLQIAQQTYLATNGAFNPAVYRLVDLWGFSSRIYSNGNFGLPYDRPVSADTFWTDGYPLPDSKYVAAFSDPAFTDFSESAVTLSQEGDKYYVTKNVLPAVVDGVSFQQWIDLGGIAKGYAVDVIKTMLSDDGFTRYSVDAGSSSQAYGANYAGNPFKLGVNDPFEVSILPPSVVLLSVSDATVSTSGQYVRKYVTDGVEYSHIVDGNSGRPANTGIRSVSVVAPENNFWAGKGDCLTTALTVMGRDKAIAFMNGYLKDNDVKVVAVYETVDGQKQLLTNYERSSVTAGDTFDNYAWAVKTDENGVFSYDSSAKAPVTVNDYRWLVIVLAVLASCAVIAVVVIHFVKGGSKTAQNVLNAKRDKPFKAGDVGAYLVVVLLIVVLFSVFLGKEDAGGVQVVKVVDFSKSGDGQELFVYNVARNEWKIYDSDEWTVEVNEEGNVLTVKFTKQFDGKERFNVMTVTRGAVTSVKMTDSVCGHSQECVRRFPAIVESDGSIVCSPNRLKIITQ